MFALTIFFIIGRANLIGRHLAKNTNSSLFSAVFLSYRWFFGRWL